MDGYNKSRAACGIPQQCENHIRPHGVAVSEDEMFFLAETAAFAFAQLSKGGGVGCAVLPGRQLVVRLKDAELFLSDAEHGLERAVVLDRRIRPLQIDEGDAGARLVKNCPEPLLAFAEH